MHNKVKKGGEGLVNCHRSLDDSPLIIFETSRNICIFLFDDGEDHVGIEIGSTSDVTFLAEFS